MAGRALEMASQLAVAHSTPPNSAQWSRIGGRLLDRSARTLRRYLVLPAHATTALTLWNAHTYAVEAFDVSPRLLITSPLKRCGKTRTLSVLGNLARDALLVSHASPAALYREMDARHPTLFLDEADGWLGGGKLLRTVVNCGFSRVASRILRSDGGGDVPGTFDAFGPMAIAMIGLPEETILDRSVVIRLQPKTQAERVERYRATQASRELEPLRRMFQIWSRRAVRDLRAAAPPMPEGMDDRALDLWEPLVAIADSAGGEWPRLAREAALHLSRGLRASTPEPALALLRDLQLVFDRLAVDRVPTKLVLRELVSIEGSPWSEWSGTRPLTPSQLADLLRRFDVGPRSVRMPDGSTPKGYMLDNLQPVFERFLHAGAATPPHLR